MNKKNNIITIIIFQKLDGIIKVTLILLLSSFYLFSQEIPKEFYQYKLGKYFFDIGRNWDQNTTFGPTRYTHGKDISDSLIITSRLGFSLSSEKPDTLYSYSKVIYGFGHFTYKSRFHGYLYSRIVNNLNYFEGYSGIPRDITRLGFRSGETDLSGISYENDWMIIQFGRGRQSWGAGNDIQISLSETCSPYDYGMLDLDFGKLKVRYFHGYLETDTLFFNRYITGRGVEWNNQKNFLLSISEVVIYSGENRPIDFAYFNPMSTHLEIELNNKQNDLGTDNGNGLWQASFDYFNRKNIRFSANYLFDEFILDLEQKKQGKNHGAAYSLRCVFTPLSLQSGISFYGSIISIGTSTFKHEDGRNNFIQRDNPLGWSIGSDAREFKFGINSLVLSKKVIGKVEISKIEIGEGNIINSPYDGYNDYNSVSFPSGNIEVVKNFIGEIEWWYKPNISLTCNFRFNKSDKFKAFNQLELGVDMFFPIQNIL